VKHALLQNALSEAVPSLHRARQTIKNAKAELAELRAKVKPPALDKTDLVSAMLRAEMRDWFRSKPQSERDRLTADPTKIDPDLARAVMEMPAELTGVSEMHRNALIERAVEAEHGNTIAEIHDLERGIELAERAVEVSRDEIRKDTGLDQNTFDNLALPVEQKQYSPWLKKVQESGEEIARVVRWDSPAKMTGSWPIATPDELARGQFFENREAYDRANAGVAE
jgi:hypothetical protein